jgi:hypothetical protein
VIEIAGAARSRIIFVKAAIVTRYGSGPNAKVPTLMIYKNKNTDMHYEMFF